MTKRILSTILVLFILTALAAGCAEKKDAGSSDDMSSDVTANTEPTETTEPQPNLPDLTFEGEQLMFLVRGPSFVEWQSQDIYVEVQNSEPVNDAVFNRNLYLEEKYEVKIREYGASDVGATAKKSFAANSPDYDVCMANTSESASLASQGYLLNLFDIDHIDLSRNWWDQRSVSQMSINNLLFFCTGDLSIMANDATWILMFNKDLIIDFTLDVPYELVAENKWTIDKMTEMSVDVSKDLDGDGKWKWDTDQYGFVTHESSCEGFFFGSGCNIIAKDSDDMPYLNMNGERVVTVIEKANSLIANKELVVNGSIQALSPTTQMQPVFESGRSLFYGEVMQCIIRLRAMEIDFGVIPFPKLDESQESYNHYVNVTAAMMSVPITNNKLEMTGFMLEAMAAKSKSTLQKAYYEICLEGKFMRDEESSGMLDIILKTRNYDIGYIYNWGNLFTAFRNCLNKGNTEFASNYAKVEKSALKAMDKTVTAWLNAQ